MGPRRTRPGDEFRSDEPVHGSADPPRFAEVAVFDVRLDKLEGDQDRFAVVQGLKDLGGPPEVCQLSRLVAELAASTVEMTLRAHGAFPKAAERLLRTYEVFRQAAGRWR